MIRKLKNMTKPNFLDYDKQYDILSIGFGDRSNAFGDEADSDYTVMRDMESNKIVGLIVWDFLRKYKSKTLPKWPDGIDINIDTDIVSNVAF
ncbi:hypothetical protein FACS1894187_15000 [Synergistales bacterium]|nr:hypothetical protein FACS1894187_15000 [Synergistales bacterium]